MPLGTLAQVAQSGLSFITTIHKNPKTYDLKFRMWFKYGLKAQKLLAQGIALGIMAISKAPCKGNSFIYCLEF